MKKNHLVNKLLTFLLVGTIVFSNTVLDKQSIITKPSNHSYEVWVKTYQKTTGVDVGMAD